MEVALALGICSFCLVAVFGLLPTGINANRNTLEQTAAASVARAVAADVWGITSTMMASGSSAKTMHFQIPLPATTNIAASTVPDQTLFIAEDGTFNASLASIPTARYRVDVAYGARNSVNQPPPVKILVTWPAQANPTTGSWPTNTTGSFQIMTTLNAF